MNLHSYLYEVLNNKLCIENNHKDRLRIYNHTGIGKVVYSPSVKGKCDPTWVILQCDDDIVDYYKWFLNKRGVKLDALMWGSHVSIIRGEAYDKINNNNIEKWKYNDGQYIEFKYGDLVTNGIHWWLEVQSDELEQMRLNLGLKPRPDFGFHITIGKVHR
jgi:hypothetical protein